jgi:hypothetical protein
MLLTASQAMKYRFFASELCTCSVVLSSIRTVMAGPRAAFRASFRNCAAIVAVFPRWSGLFRR